jgi:cyanophycinase
VFICGGLTPAYYEALCVDKTWLEYLFENNIPYCGFSAGSSVASEKAIIGGWQRKINDQIVEIADEHAGEDIDLLDVRNGLGLVDFSVDVHASQWGTLSRLIHAIEAEFAVEGWAIDENTLLEIIDGEINIFGAGNVYHASRRNGEIMLKIFQTNEKS